MIFEMCNYTTNFRWYIKFQNLTDVFVRSYHKSENALASAILAIAKVDRNQLNSINQTSLVIKWKRLI